MKSLAVQYLQQDQITDYQDLKIQCVDTVTEFAYAALTNELITNMEDAYQRQYDSAIVRDDERLSNTLELYLREMERTRNDINDLMVNGDLQSKGILLYMVTGSYNKDGADHDFMFLALPDKKTLHTLDPFSNNLLYKDE